MSGQVAGVARVLQISNRKTPLTCAVNGVSFNSAHQKEQTVKTKTIIVTISNQLGTKIKNGAHYCYGISPSEFPGMSPGAMYEVQIKYIGSDPSEEPTLSAFIPHGQFGRYAYVDKHAIAECRKFLRSRKPNPEKAWWKSRLKNLLLDKAAYLEAVKTHRNAVREWKENI